MPKIWRQFLGFFSDKNETQVFLQEVIGLKKKHVSTRYVLFCLLLKKVISNYSAIWNFRSQAGRDGVADREEVK